MTTPSVTYEEIVAWVGQDGVKRGAPYAKNALSDLRRTGNTLKARCQGTAAWPYRVSATIGPRGRVTDDSCSCPIGGHCKHVGALLLAWMNDPVAFMEVEDLIANLERRDKPELIALIKQMLVRHPELETLIELPLPVKGKRAKPADAAKLRREIANAFQHAGDDWHAAAEVAVALEPLVQIGDDYAQLGDLRSAATVYQTIAQGVLEQYDRVQDEEGDLNGIVDACVTGLERCLGVVQEAAQREAMLRSLFEIYRWDVDFGRIGMGEEAPELLVSMTTPEERKLVARWVRDVLPVGNEWIESYHREIYGGLLLELEQDTLDDEAYLRVCRETGRQYDLVDRLLSLGRLQEAEAEIRNAHDSRLLRLADLLSAYGHAGRAEALVRERYAATQKQQAFALWLRERVRARGDWDEAIQLTEAIFWSQPSITGYKELKSLVQAHGKWPVLRESLLARLEEGRQYALLTEIYLEDGDVERALVTVEQVKSPFSMFNPMFDRTLQLRVAEAAEKTQPHAAIAIYRKAADRMIEARGRDQYASAAQYLARVRTLYLRLDERATWDALIGAIRTDNKRLRALQEELDRAKL